MCSVASKYRLGRGRRILNALARASIWAGVGDGRMHLLTVRGRSTGKPMSTPVNVVTLEGRRWLVSPYGDREWTKNARAAGEVTLSRARKSEVVRLTQVDAQTAAPVLREYLRTTRITAPYFDVTADSTNSDFENEAPKHPVFAIADE